MTREAERNEIAGVETATAEVAATQTQLVITPTLTLLPSPTPSPEWTMLDDFDTHPGGVYEMLVAQGGNGDAIQFSNSACPLEIAGYSVDLAVEEAPRMQPFSAHLGLHGIGTRRSWYAQIGYQYSPQTGLTYFCQAYSYSSSAERYWESLGPAPLGSMNTLGIEVIPIEAGWGYAFRFLLNGQAVCYFQPPDLWDGDNRYDVMWRGVELYLDGANNADEPIIIQLDNYEGYESPLCGDHRWGWSSDAFTNLSRSRKHGARI